MQAEFSGQIEVGDALVAVNGVPVAANLTPQLLGALLGRVGRPVHVAFRKCPPAPTPPAPPPTLAPASGTSAGNGRSAINSGGGSDGGSDSKSTEGWAAWSAAAAAAADSMDPEVYAAAAAAASHMGSLALAGLGAAGVMDASSSSSKLPHDRSGSPGLLSLEDSDLSRSSNLYAESGALQGGDDGKGESTGVTHAEDGFELPRLLGECYSASLNGVQMEAFHRARLGDGGLQRTWVRGQVRVVTCASETTDLLLGASSVSKLILLVSHTLSPVSSHAIFICLSGHTHHPSCSCPTIGSTSTQRLARYGAPHCGLTGAYQCTTCARWKRQNPTTTRARTGVGAWGAP